jgi:PAB1-binding protein PBP1
MCNCSQNKIFFIYLLFLFVTYCVIAHKTEYSLFIYYFCLCAAFTTDTNISRANGMSGLMQKELVVWHPDEGEEHHLGLDDCSEGGWSAEEMIRTNEAKFNVSSTYDSSLAQYT